MAQVSVLGMGAMGSRMAHKLVQAGHQVTVWNRSEGRTALLREAGATVASSAREAVHGAQVVLSVVRDDAASRDVWLHSERGALVAVAPEAVVIERSTLSLAWVHELARACASNGAGFIDAPVLGSRPQAEAAQLISLVGGDPGVLERARPVLEAMGSAVHHVGPVGAGAALKLAANALFSVQVAAVAELLELLRSTGVELDRAVEVLGATPVMSLAARGAAASMLTSSFAPAFPLELVEKDLGYLLALGDAARAPLSATSREVFARAVSKGLAGQNLTAVISLYR